MKDEFKKENCVSFCEVLHALSAKSSMDNILSEACIFAGYNSIERIYIGSNFCSQYFLSCQSETLSQLALLCQKKNIKITLCIPIISEKNLLEAKGLIEKLYLSFNNLIDETTVNDYAMAIYIARKYPDQKINLGRLFQKDTRDIRYPEYFSDKIVPSTLAYDFHKLVGITINSVEFDPTNSTIDLSGLKCVPAIYTPYCFATVGNICEYASIGKQFNEKFRPNADCTLNCQRNVIRYFYNDNTQYLKVGRAVFFKNLDWTITGVGQYREIFEPFDVFSNMEGGYE